MDKGRDLALQGITVQKIGKNGQDLALQGIRFQNGQHLALQGIMV